MLQKLALEIGAINWTPHSGSSAAIWHEKTGTDLWHRNWWQTTEIQLFSSKCDNRSI